MPKKKQGFITQANYVGLTIDLKQVKDPDLKYRVTVKYLAKAFHNYVEVTDEFEVRLQMFSYDSLVEALGKFNKIKNQVRHLGQFRNLNSKKLPDYRDEPN